MIELLLVISGIKLLWLPSYHSTDFEVHRNWLAITNSLPINKWYEDETSQWTLDYPPFFAWFEYFLSKIAKLFDPEMVKVSNLNYASQRTILFQNLSVIVSDFVLIYSMQRCVKIICKKSTRSENEKLFIFLIVVANAGLLIVDHLHFQYNGFLFGLLILSISAILQGNHLSAAFWFAVLLNFKHIYLYMAPAYFVYLLRSYCFSSQKSGKIVWKSFSTQNFLRLAIIVASVFAVSLGPFILLGQSKQVLTRLFPFKRGLSHAYWAPNFWALYNFADKLASFIGTKTGLYNPVAKASMTGGLVQEFDHSVLPSVTPLFTFMLTFLAMLPALLKLWRNPNNPWQFIRTVTMCSFCSYLFGWHVHEKAILLVTLPMGLLCLAHREDARLFCLMNIIGNFSLFPLIFTQKETIIKVSVFLFHCIYTTGSICKAWNLPRQRYYLGLKCQDLVYIFGLLCIYLYDSVLHRYIPYANGMDFLPLMLISVYCAFGFMILWFYYYYAILFTSIRMEHRKVM